MNFGELVRVFNRYLLTIIILSTTVVTFLYNQQPDFFDQQLHFLWGMFVLLVALPILFAIQGVLSFKLKQSCIRNFLFSIGTWFLASFVLAPETHYIYFLFYTCSYWGGTTITMLFRKSFLYCEEV